MASISNLVINVDTSQLEKAISLTKELKELLGGMVNNKSQWEIPSWYIDTREGKFYVNTDGIKAATVSNITLC